MVRLQMKTTIAGPKYSCAAGGILTVETQGEAKALVDAGYATIMPGQMAPGVKALKIESVETAAIAPAETAVGPRALHKKQGR